MTLTVRMDVLGTRVEGMQEGWRPENGVSELLKKFNLMIKKWDVLERDKKEKGVETNSPDTTKNRDNLVTSQGSGKNTEIRGR